MKELEDDMIKLIGSADDTLNISELSFNFIKAMECLNNCIKEGKNNEKSSYNGKGVVETSERELQYGITKYKPFEIC